MSNTNPHVNASTNIIRPRIVIQTENIKEKQVRSNFEIK
jgi:hypothetical protein